MDNNTKKVKHSKLFQKLFVKRFRTFFGTKVDSSFSNFHDQNYDIST